MLVIIVNIQEKGKGRGKRIPGEAEEMSGQCWVTEIITEVVVVVVV